MNNFETAINATTTAEQSAGSAERENARYMESLEAKVQALKTAFGELVLGEGGLTQFAKLILDIGIKLLEFANSDVGQVVIKIGLLVAAIQLLNVVIGTQTIQAFELAAERLIAFAAEEGIVAAATVGLEGAMTGLLAVMDALLLNPVVAAIAGIVAVVTLAYKAYKKWESGIEDTKKALDETYSSIEEEKQKIQDLNNQIDELNKQKATIVDNDDLRKLEIQEASLENQLAIEKAITEQLNDQARKEAEKLKYKTGKSVGFDEHGWGELGFSKGAMGTVIGTSDEMLQQQIKDLEELSNRLRQATQDSEFYRQQAIALGVTEQQLTAGKNELNEIEKQLGSNAVYAITQYQHEVENISQLDSWFKQVNGSAAENASIMQQVIDAGLDTNGAFSKVIDTWRKLGKEFDNIDVSDEADDLKELDKGLQDLAKQVQALASEFGVSTDEVWDMINGLDGVQEGSMSSTEALANVREQLEQNAEITQTATDQYQELVKNLDNIAEAYETLQAAVDEYNSTGQFSIENASKLLQLEPEYLSLLSFENDQLVLNKEAYNALVDAKIAEAKASLMASAEEQVHAVVLQDLGIEASDMGSNLINAAKNTQTSANNIYNASLTALEAGENFAIAWSKITPSNEVTYGLSGEAKAAIEGLRKSAENAWNTYDHLGNSIKSAGSAAKSAGRTATRAANSANDAAKELENTVKNIRDYIITKMDKYIGKIENKIEQVEDKISNLEKRIEKIKDKYEALIEINTNWMSVLENNFDIVKTFESTGNKAIDGLLKQLAKLQKTYDQSIALTEIAIAIREKQIDQYDDELDKLKDVKQETEDYYDSLINDLEKTNTELERQIKLEELLDALNKAKSTKVMTYTQGGGFQYGVNVDAVSGAQKNLQEYQRELQQAQHKEALELEKKNAVDQIEQQIKIYEQLKESSEKEKERFEEQKIRLTNEFNATKEELSKHATHIYQGLQEENKELQNAMNRDIDAVQQRIDKANTKLTKLNTKLETANERLDKFKTSTDTKLTTLNATDKKVGDNVVSQLKDSNKSVSNIIGTFKTSVLNAFGALQSSIANMTTSIANASSSNSDSDSSSSSSSSSSSKSSSSSSKSSSSSSKSSKSSNSSSKSSKSSPSTPKKKKASGDRYIDEDSMYLVGDNPNQNELAIGSRLNGAIAIGLNKGSGVVPHTLTSALIDMATEYQRGQSNAVLNGTTNNSKSTTISIGNIELPNVSDANSFVDCLQNFSLDMTQEAYSRK